jgi:hypothetical protein
LISVFSFLLSSSSSSATTTTTTTITTSSSSYLIVTSNQQQPDHTVRCISNKLQLSSNDQRAIEDSCHSLANIDQISSFATLNTSMLFLPRTTVHIDNNYIDPSAVVKVMQQQQQLKRQVLSSHVHLREDNDKYDESSISSQRDSGLGSGIHDGSSDDSLEEHESIQAEHNIEHSSMNGQLEFTDRYS